MATERGLARWLVSLACSAIALLPGAPAAQELSCGGRKLRDAYERGWVLHAEREDAGAAALRQALRCFTAAAESARQARLASPERELLRLEVAAERATGRCHQELGDLGAAREHLAAAHRLNDDAAIAGDLARDLGRVILEQARAAVDIVARCDLGREAQRALPPADGAEAAAFAEAACAVRPWRVEFSSEPPGASVEVAGKGSCPATPCALDFPPGEYEVVFRRACSQPRRAAFRVSDASTSVRAELGPACGRAALATQPPGVDLYLDGEPGPSERLRELVPGTHRVEVRDDCYRGDPVSFQVAVGQEVAVAVPLVRRSTSLLVAGAAGTDVAGAVFVDGGRLGALPFTGEVPSCSRELRVDGAGGTWREALSLRGKRTERIEVPAWVTTAPPPPPIPPERSGFYFGLSNMRLRDTRLHVGWLSGGEWQVGGDLAFGVASQESARPGVEWGVDMGGLSLVVQRRLTGSLFLVGSAGGHVAWVTCRTDQKAVCAQFMEKNAEGDLALNSWTWAGTLGLRYRLWRVNLGVGVAYARFGFRESDVAMGPSFGPWLWLGGE